MKSKLGSIKIQDVDTSRNIFQTVGSTSSYFMDLIQDISKKFCVSMILLSLVILIILSVGLSCVDHFTPQMDQESTDLSSLYTPSEWSSSFRKQIQRADRERDFRQYRCDFTR